RMKKLLGSKDDFEIFSEIVHREPRSFIRCNTLKISSEVLFSRLEKKWKVSQPFSNKEIILVESELGPGELGKSIEHLLGYYYIQEISSMMSVLALEPQPGELVLDVAASPGRRQRRLRP